LSVIVVGPNLKMHQCGLPRLMAVELFKPFVMKVLVDRALAPNIRSAKQMVERLRPEVWDVLEDVIKEHPVMLNRAPTLHRLGIQAFEPVLVEGKAIQVHPLVCAAFNADFDGDQMAVHVPLSPEAQAEARILMLSTQNILQPSNGFPIAVPSQDMVLGLYYITYADGGFDEADSKAFISGYDEAEAAYREGTLRLHDKITFRRNSTGEKIQTTLGRAIFNDHIEYTLRNYLVESYDPLDYEFLNHQLKKSEIKDLVAGYVDVYPTELVSHLLDTLKDVGFNMATRAGISVGKNDIVVPEQKQEILERYEGLVNEIEDQWDMGFISDDERFERVIGLWTEAKNEVEEVMKGNLWELNPITMMANSGARGNYSQITQLAGMRGLMTNTKGEIIDEPVKSNFMEGLSVLEYFTSTHGGRKGQADTALRTADSGYLTRRLVDVSQDVVVTSEDCGTDGYVDLPLYLKNGDGNDSISSRFLARDLVNPETGEVVAEAGLDVTPKIVEGWREELPRETMISVRTPSKCENSHGVCQHCYGRSLSTYRPVDVGEAVGIIAAQSIGEPGTQLTMRTFHTGGIAGEDITAGLPRVVELFEARHPKAEATIAEIDGHVTLEETDADYTVKVVLTSDDGTESREYRVERQLLRDGVYEGADILAGTQITEGSAYPHEILEADLRNGRDSTQTERYLVEEVQKVYQSQGVDIHDKHIEVVVRQMLRKVVVDEPGDTSFLPEQVTDRFTMRDENAGLEEESEPATAHTVLMGITKASLATDSFLSAASFQETARVLTDAAIEGKSDGLNGLKENVIIGKLIPAATGLSHYRQLAVSVDGYETQNTEDLDIAAS
ncbi:MAG: DNA-directed RNA polymerase subunit beta', partial [Rubrobacter sp.]|nr:DNA-directed RNA polymerase subunit beta' [Rubrobacter sp.]